MSESTSLICPQRGLVQMDYLDGEDYKTGFEPINLGVIHNTIRTSCVIVNTRKHKRLPIRERWSLFSGYHYVK